MTCFFGYLLDGTLPELAIQGFEAILRQLVPARAPYMLPNIQVQTPKPNRSNIERLGFSPRALKETNLRRVSVNPTDCRADRNCRSSHRHKLDMDPSGDLTFPHGLPVAAI